MTELSSSVESYIQPVTTYVRRGEPAYALAEINLPTPDHKAKHRYQIIYVLRGDKVTEFRRDLGDRSKFGDAPQLRIPSFWVHEVGELMDMAEELRDTSYWTEGETQLPNAKDSTLAERYNRKLETRDTIQKGRYTPYTRSR